MFNLWKIKIVINIYYLLISDFNVFYVKGIMLNVVAKLKNSNIWLFFYFSEKKYRNKNNKKFYNSNGNIICCGYEIENGDWFEFSW